MKRCQICWQFLQNCSKELALLCFPLNIPDNALLATRNNNVSRLSSVRGVGEMEFLCLCFQMIWLKEHWAASPSCFLRTTRLGELIDWIFMFTILHNIHKKVCSSSMNPMASKSGAFQLLEWLCPSEKFPMDICDTRSQNAMVIERSIAFCKLHLGFLYSLGNRSQWSPGQDQAKGTIVRCGPNEEYEEAKPLRWFHNLIEDKTAEKHSQISRQRSSWITVLCWLVDHLHFPKPSKA